MSRDDRRHLLRHFLAALAYRTQKAVQEAPADYADLRITANARTPHEIVWHMTGLMGYVIVLLRGGEWKPDQLDTFPAELERFHAKLEGVATVLAAEAISTEVSERLLQGPLADAMTHVGQLALLRRCAGDPVHPENFFRADVDPANLGPDQPPSRAPKEGWHPDQPPPAPGRPLTG